MKKLFTSLLLLGMCLCGWAESTDPSLSADGKTLTVPYVADFASFEAKDFEDYLIEKLGVTGENGNKPGKKELENYLASMTTLKFVGDYTNADFEAGKVVEKLITSCTKADGNKICLDLAACDKIICKLEYIGTGDPNYFTNDFRFVYSNDMTQKAVTNGDLYFDKKSGSVYTGDVAGVDPNYYYIAWYENGAPYKPYVQGKDPVEYATKLPLNELERENGVPFYRIWYDVSNNAPYTQSFWTSHNTPAFNDLLPGVDNNHKKYYVWYDENTDAPYDGSHGTIDNLTSTDDQNVKLYYVWYDKSTNEPYAGNLNELTAIDDTHKSYTLYYEGETLYEGVVKFDNDGEPYYEECVVNENGVEIDINGNDYYNLREIWLPAIQKNTYSNIGDIYIAFEGAGWNEDHTVFTFKSYNEYGATYTVSFEPHELTAETVIVERHEYEVENREFIVENRQFKLEEERFALEKKNVYYYTETYYDDTANANVTRYIVVDEDDVDTETGMAMVTATGTPLSFAKIKEGKRVNSIIFPSSNNFTAVPDRLLEDYTTLENITFDNNTKVEWIGKKAFKGCTSLNDFSLPKTIKVIGVDAFHQCTNLDVVDLSNLSSLCRVDAAAFSMDNTDATKNQIKTVLMPTSKNEVLKFWGNQVFSSTNITSLDFSNCYGIYNFAYDGENTFGEAAGTPGNIPSYATFTYFQRMTSIKLPPNLTYVAENAFSFCTDLETATFTGQADYVNCELTNPLIIGSQAFKDRDNLTTVNFSNNLTVIQKEAFEQSGLTKAVIPASVEEIQTKAFNDCNNLTTVVFEEFNGKNCEECDPKGPATITVRGGDGQGAFWNCEQITDVYVNNTQIELDCENLAFDYAVTYGHGDPTANLATLHFPKKYTDNYVNLMHGLTDAIVADPGEFHKWLMEHLDQAINPYQNGWYEFVNAGPAASNTDPPCEAIILRTFSDYTYNYLVPNGLRAYVVNGIENKGDFYEVTLKRILAIPKQTGVILYGHPNGKTPAGDPTLVLTPVAFEEGSGIPLRRSNWYNADGTQKNYVKNYLEPLLSADGNAVPVTPYEKEETTGKVKFRNFALSSYSDTDYNSGETQLKGEATNYVGFFRIKKGNYASGYAYLHLSGDVDEEGNSFPVKDAQGKVIADSEYKSATGAEILVREDAGQDGDIPYYFEYSVTDGSPFDARAEYVQTGHGKNPKGWWVEANNFTWKYSKTSWGDRTKQWTNSSSVLEYLGEMEDADGIVKLVVPANNADGDFYTLQGVKVMNPTKGIYIQNGKKIIVK